jgi:hypothetical protein
VKTEKEKSGLVGSAKMLGSVVELVAPDDDDKKHVDVKGALPRGTIVPRQVKESRISLSVRLTSPQLFVFLFCVLLLFGRREITICLTKRFSQWRMLLKGNLNIQHRIIFYMYFYADICALHELVNIYALL